MVDIVIMTWGDGISWENFAYEAIGETNGNIDKIFFKYGQDKKKDEIIDRLKKHIKKLIRGNNSGGNNSGIIKILDIGCSIGRWVGILKELKIEGLGIDYYGVDQSEEAIRIAVKYSPKELFYRMFLWDLSFENEFDIIFCNNVLQHNTLEEKKRILIKIRKALKNDGLGLLFINESTVLSDTMTQLTYNGWIRLIESYDFDFIESWQKNDIGLDEAYLFKGE